VPKNPINPINLPTNPLKVRENRKHVPRFLKNTSRLLKDTLRFLKHVLRFIKHVLRFMTNVLRSMKNVLRFLSHKPNFGRNPDRYEPLVRFSTAYSLKISSLSFGRFEINHLKSFNKSSFIVNSFIG
jgi:hypothetical protein